MVVDILVGGREREEGNGGGEVSSLLKRGFGQLRISALGRQVLMNLPPSQATISSIFI
jgi:hypothetical protein